MARRIRWVRLRCALLLAVIVGGIAVAPLASGVHAAAGERKAPRRVPANLTIVVLAEGADPLAAAHELGAKPVYVYTSVFAGFAADLPAAAASVARRSGAVAGFTPDSPVRIASQVVPTGVSRIAAGPDDGGRPEHGDVDVDVAVLDSGVARHPDLDVRPGASCIGKRSTRDRDGHGTHVAGIVGAKDNDVGVVGVAPGARIWAVKVLGVNGGGTKSSVICGLDWVHKHRATIDVVNMSLSTEGEDGPCRSEAFHRAVCRVVDAGIPVVVAAGNRNERNQDASRVVPAAWPETIAVSAFADSDGRPGGLGPPACDGLGDADDSFAFFSNFGAAVDIAAPGECILSTWKHGKTRLQSGTSMASPHVAGAVARYVAAHPDAGVAAVRDWLLTGASRPQGSPEGFSGDVDAAPEPALYLGT